MTSSCRSVARARVASSAALLAAVLARPARAQGPGFDLTYGRWWSDGGAILYSAGYHRPLLGPFDGGVALVHVDDHNAVEDRTLTGGEATLGIARTGSGPYAVGSAGLGPGPRDGSRADAGGSAAGPVPPAAAPASADCLRPSQSATASHAPARGTITQEIAAIPSPIAPTSSLSYDHAAAWSPTR